MHSLTRSLASGYVSTLAAILGNLILLPLAYAYLQPVQIGLWFNYLTIFSFLLLLDFGVTGTATREMGKSWFWKYGDKIDLSFFAGLLLSFRRIYNQIAIAATLIAILLCSPYLLSIADYEGGRQDVLYSWPINCMAIYVFIRYLYLVPALRGMDRIDIVYNSTTFSKIFQVFSAYLMLEMGLGIAAISISFLISTIFARAYLYIAISNSPHIKNSKILSSFPGQVSNVNAPDLIRKVWKNGAISLAVFFQDKASIFYVSIFAGLAAAERYGLTVQILGILAAVSNVYYKSCQKKLIDNYLSKSTRGAITYILRSILSQILILGGGGVVLFFSANYIFALAQMEAKLIEPGVYFILLFYLLMFNVQFICVNYLMIADDFSMLYPYLGSAALYAASIYVASKFIDIGIPEIVGIQFFIMLLYNGWFWPWRAIRSLREREST